MNLDELQSTQHRERRTDSLQQLRDSFYRDVGEYVAELKAQRDHAADAADDPFSDPEVRRLTDEIESAKEVVEAIYERRMGKLVKHASLVAAGMDADEEGMTDEERDLFYDIVDRIQRNKTTVLEVLEGEDVDASVPDPTPADAGEMSAASVMGGDPEGAAEGRQRGGTEDTGATDRGDSERTEERGTGEPTEERDDRRPPEEAEAVTDGSGATAAPGSSAGRPNATAEPDTGGPDAAVPESGTGTKETTDGEAGPGTPTAATAGGDGVAGSGTRNAGGREPDDDRMTVRITDDVGEIFGVDERAYDLHEEDVVALPKENAEVLVESDAAERFD